MWFNISISKAWKINYKDQMYFSWMVTLMWEALNFKSLLTVITTCTKIKVHSKRPINKYWNFSMVHKSMVCTNSNNTKHKTKTKLDLRRIKHMTKSRKHYNSVKNNQSTKLINIVLIYGMIRLFFQNQTMRLT